MPASCWRIARRRVATLLCAATGVLAPIAAARAACTWIESVTEWNGTISWSYAHQATWSDGGDMFQGQTNDQVSMSADLDGFAPAFAQGPLEGTMTARQRLDVTPSVGLPGYTLLEASGPVDAHGPPPPQMFLSLDSQSCTYTFGYGQLGANGTSTVKSGCCTNSVPAIVDPGSLTSGLQPIPETRQPLTFSGPVRTLTLPPLPPFYEPYYSPPNPAERSADFLGDEQLGKANAQWSFQPGNSVEPPNDACAGATAIGAAAQDVSTATAAASDPTPTCGDGDRSVWFLMQAEADGLASISTTGSDYATIVSVWPMAQACGALTTQLACGNGSAVLSVEAGETYRVQVTRASGSTSGLVVTTFVPEPAGAMSFAAAALTLGWWRSRTASTSTGRVSLESDDCHG